MAGGASHRTERLMCLVFILKARGRRGITRAELRVAIEDYANCASDQAFERMLERDKRDLRDAGVAIDVVQRDAWHEDEHAYVLAQHTLASLPRFTADELRALGLAAEAWEHNTWQALASGALHKLEVFGSEFVADVQPRISLQGDPHLQSLRSAVRNRERVQFRYRRPGDRESSLRTVEPWGLLHRDGGWYCVGFDGDRLAARVFRTSRISGEVTVAGTASSEIQPDWSVLLDNYFTTLQPLVTTLLIVPGHGWAWRNAGMVVGQRSINGTTYDEVRTDITERDGLIGALAAAAPWVLVAEPSDLRQRVVEHLQEVANG